MTIHPHLPVVFSMVCLLLSCSRNPESKSEKNGLAPVTKVSLDSVTPTVQPFILKRPPLTPRYPLEKKRLKVLTLHSINSFFLYDGEEYGLEYELLKMYAHQADMAIDIVTVENYKQMYDSMSHGNFDMAMGTLFVNEAMDSITPFSNTLYHSDVILATSGTKAPQPAKNASPVHVIHHSPLHFWMDENDSIPQHFMDSINHIEVGLSKELALERVATNEFPSLVVDKHDFLIMHS